VNWRNIALQALSLFSSIGTLVCCALPALLVSIGAGAVMVTVVSAVPQLVWLSEHKVPLFCFAGSMLLLVGISNHRNRNAPCPIDPDQARSCLRLRRWSQGIVYLSAAIFLVGFFFAFVASRVIR
jgi:hypothetical protein